MAIFRYDVKVKVIIKDMETDAEREETFTRTLASMHMQGTKMYIELIDTAVDEMIEEIEESLLDIEEITSCEVEVLKKV